MALQFSTRLNDAFFTAILSDLERGGAPKISLYTAGGLELVTLQFPASLKKGQTETILSLNAPPPELVLEDGEITSATIFNGLGQPVVTFGVGSETVNPSAEMIISSTVAYAGGMITLTKVELTI